MTHTPPLSAHGLSRRHLLRGAGAGALGLVLAPMAVPAWAKSLHSADTRAASWPNAAPLDAALDDAVVKRQIVGVTALVAQDGRIVHRHAAGFADRQAGRVMREDEVCRLASMTKPIVSLTALALVDKGHLHLDDPVHRWLPDFRPQLADGSTPDITIRHLLTHTAGLNYGFLEKPDGPYHQLGVSDGLDSSGLTLDENIHRIAAAPLLFKPGNAWHYSLATDVLGAVIGKAADKPLPDAVRDLVTAPLGMTKTYFVAPADTRLATPYHDADPQPVPMSDPFSLPFAQSAVIYSPARAFDADAFPSGGAGLVGTAEDYVRFAEAIRTGGAGIISADTARAMTTNAVGDLTITAAGPGYGWGLGVCVVKDPQVAGVPLSRGSWMWSGIYGTHFWVDPARRLTVVVLTNTAIAGMSGPFPQAVREAVYAS